TSTQRRRATRTRAARTRVAVAAAGLAIILAACGGDDEGDDVFEGNGDGDGDTAASGELTVGGANFTEMLVMEEMYRLLLEDAGYTVDIQSVDNRRSTSPHWKVARSMSCRSMPR